MTKVQAENVEIDADQHLIGSSIGQRVIKVIIASLAMKDPDIGKICEKSNFIDDLGADSLDMVETVMAFEEEFSIEIPDEDAQIIQTVADAIKYVASKVE